MEAFTIRRHDAVLQKNAPADGFILHDNLSELEPGFFRLERTFKNTTQSARLVTLRVDVETRFKPEFYMIPAVSYHGNHWGTGSEPKGLACDGKPWVFAYNRTSLPSATFSEDGCLSFGLFAAEDSLVSSCSMTETDGGMLHSIIWPDREEPLTYTSRDEYSQASTPELSVGPGEEVMVSCYLCLSTVERKNFGWTRAYDLAYKRYARDLPVPMTAEEFWRLRVSYIKTIQYIREEDRYDLFDMGLLVNGTIGNYFGDPQGAVWKTRNLGHHRFEIGWCGQNASQAVSLIHDYIVNKNEDSLRIGTAVLDTWAENAPLPSGLFVVQFDDLLDKPYEIDTCNLGWGIWQLLEAYESLQSIGIDKPAYKKMALDCCDFFVSHRAPDGSFGKSWHKDGTPGDPGGTVGCYVLLGLAKAYQVTGNTRYLDCAREMFGFYVGRDLDAMACTAGALDTHCIDKETCWPLLKTGLDLYEQTEDAKYLDDARCAAYYMLSFTFQYDAQYEPDTDFALHGYRTVGATSVSTQHHHLDPWGSLIAFDFYRLYKATGEEKWETWATFMWRNAMLGVSDGSLVIHGLTRPASSQNEAFLQSRFTFRADCKPGRFNDWLQSWPGAFKLITIRRARQDGLDIADVFEKDLLCQG